MEKMVLLLAVALTLTGCANTLKTRDEQGKVILKEQCSSWTQICTITGSEGRVKVKLGKGELVDAEIPLMEAEARNITGTTDGRAAVVEVLRRGFEKMRSDSEAAKKSPLLTEAEYLEIAPLSLADYLGTMVRDPKAQATALNSLQPLTQKGNDQ